ncbi:hypothetical protein L484_009215 [Morus notabilis]|uniref:Defensin-like protein n=2 Tax=Morus notabilis TaxID=981085 RepID=W9SDZ9_9ROSA|nr:hypothetical protein L484_009215 [Morus notabilis]
MGGCDPQCGARCEAAHPGGQSSCDAATSMCKCFYQCGQPIAPPPAPGKRCNVGLGPCSAACYDDCCNKKCAERYPGDLGGYGYCYSAIGPIRYITCMCYFRCQD